MLHMSNSYSAPLFASFLPPSPFYAQWIQLQLWERHGLRTLRRTLSDLASQVGGGESEE